MTRNGRRTSTIKKQVRPVRGASRTSVRSTDYNTNRMNSAGSYGIRSYSDYIRSERQMQAPAGTMQSGHYSRYNHTSSALAYDFEPEEAPRPEVHRVVKKVVKSRYVKQSEVIPVGFRKAVFGIALIAVFIVVLLRFSLTNNAHRESIVAMQETVDELREDNKYTRQSIDESLNLKEVESKALELGLQKPAEYQMIDISVPRDSYAVQYNTEQSVHHSLVDTVKTLLEMK